MAEHTTAHIPLEELTVLHHALAGAVNDLSYRAASMEMSVPPTDAKAHAIAKRYRDDEKRLTTWQGRLSNSATFSEDEMRELITLLMDTAYNFGGFGCNDLESDFPLPTEKIRRNMKHHYALWAGEDEDSLLFDEPFTTYSSLLGYFAYRLNPDMEAQIRQVKHEKELR